MSLSIYKLNKKGDSTTSCLTPLPTENTDDKEYSTDKINYTWRSLATKNRCEKSESCKAAAMTPLIRFERSEFCVVYWSIWSLRYCAGAATKKKAEMAWTHTQEI